jgi:hypothetical protein
MPILAVLIFTWIEVRRFTDLPQQAAGCGYPDVSKTETISGKKDDLLWSRSLHFEESAESR